MAEIRHLAQAPVIEAILAFQADISSQWDSQDIRGGLPIHFPGFPEIQEQRTFEAALEIVQGEEPRPSFHTNPAGIFLLHKGDRTAAIQLRRDGFAFSQLMPYPGWDHFIAEALEQWSIFQKWLGVDEPYSVFVRFINRLSYPTEGFRLSHYFETPPAPPSGTGWGFKIFREHHFYCPPDGRYTIESVFSREQDGESPKTAEFLLDLTISPVYPFAELDADLDQLLGEMRVLKNQAFFSKLTEEALTPYL
ncbi:TIGR04255 family protein [Luteolibacter luteus]|uniref:TIGR04255 family protein n=1 Tax=Luteolibacter luteus TaxID=2728835 RepID=A0A858RFV4_9BACT|nr:TIGR04255 family protein [Luteolibacter luteus]QJE95996.1 TIGR04255 family protein [Luteolibacter luteus]